MARFFWTSQGANAITPKRRDLFMVEMGLFSRDPRITQDGNLEGPRQSRVSDAEVWFAEYQPGDCAEEHDHAGQSRTSFCYYLDAETNSSPLTFVQKEWTNNGPMTVSKTNLPVAQGLLAMWPSVLKHEVAKTDKRRYIIAGNINDLSYKEDY